MTSSERRLTLGPGVRESLVEHAREGAPEEVCGVLVGDGDGRSVRASRRVSNVAAEPRTRYELAPAETFEAIEAAEDDGDDVVGFYHSHPRGPAEPSAVDRAQATWPGYVYCIVSLGGDGDASDPEIRAWEWTGEEFLAFSVADE